MVGDKYWVGLFRRHQVKFGSGKNITVTDYANHDTWKNTFLNEKTMCFKSVLKKYLQTIVVGWFFLL